jgi:hypothetical protein
MASVWVRYDNGQEDEWHLTDELGVKTGEVVGQLIHALSKGSTYSFAVMPEEGFPGTDYGFVGVNMAKVVAWRLDGLVNAAAAAALWAEMGGPSEEKRP